MLAALAMTVSSLTVVLNALRLKFFKPRHMTSVSENLRNNTETCPIQMVAEQSASPTVSQIFDERFLLQFGGLCGIVFTY